MRALDDSVRQSAAYGNKALGLALLRSKGFAVPDAFVIAPDDPIDEAGVWAAVEAFIPGALDRRGAASLAVRSSSAAEDSVTQSAAGQFTSVVGLFTSGELVQAIKRVRESGHQDSLPVIVQVAISPLISGVAFSCDPVSFDRRPYLVSWAEGTGQDIAAGRDEGTTLIARSAHDCDGHWPHNATTLGELISALDVMEVELRGPADVEWAIDGDGKVWLLQARPVVLPRSRCTDVRTGAGLASLPGVVVGISKMRLRAAALRLGVMMPDAAVLTVSGAGSISELPEWIPGPDASGLSIVLLHPCTASGKAGREFAQVDGTDVAFFTHGCRRYAIRRYPSRDSALAITNDVISRGLEDSWLASIAVEEIHDVAATGIIRKLGDDYIAELVVGHFAAKGVVEPSRFVISRSGEVLESRRVDQDIAYRFINGYVVTEHPVEEQLPLSDHEIAYAVGQVIPLFGEYPEVALEFGVTKSRDDTIRGFVIDMAESDSESSAKLLARELIRDGILSPGRAEGEARKLNNDEDNFDMRSLVDLASEGGKIENVIFVADRASVDLLPLVSICADNSAFVFRRASLLAHLCVVLRERGIPAISVEDDGLFEKLATGLRLTVEASDPDWLGPRVS